MSGGGSGAVGMRLNIMTALYLPILGYAMSTFDLNPDALVLNSENLYKFTLPSNGKEIEFKLLTHGDEQEITKETQALEKLNKNFSKIFLSFNTPPPTLIIVNLFFIIN